MWQAGARLRLGDLLLGVMDRPAASAHDFPEPGLPFQFFSHTDFRLCKGGSPHRLLLKRAGRLPACTCARWPFVTRTPLNKHCASARWPRRDLTLGRHCSTSRRRQRVQCSPVCLQSSWCSSACWRRPHWAPAVGLYWRSTAHPVRRSSLSSTSPVRHASGQTWLCARCLVGGAELSAWTRQARPDPSLLSPAGVASATRPACWASAASRAAAWQTPLVRLLACLRPVRCSGWPLSFTVHQSLQPVLC